MIKIMKQRKLSLTILTFLCIGYLFTLNSCDKDEESIDIEESSSSTESSVKKSTTAQITYTDTSIMNETSFNNGSLSPFYSCNTGGGNTASVVSSRLKCYWKQSNYNSRLTRNFKGAEICSPIYFREQVYVGFKVFIPSSTAGTWSFPDNRNTTITQILSANGCSSWSAMLEIKNNDLYISHRSACVTGTVEKILTGVPRDQWLSFQLRYVPSDDNHGGVQIIYDGNTIYSKTGVDFAWGVFSGQNVLDSSSSTSYMRVKYGMYCHDADSYTGSSYTNDSRTIYFDNVSVRQGSNGWNYVDPDN